MLDLVKSEMIVCRKKNEEKQKVIDTDNAIISSIRKALADMKLFDDRVSV